MSSRFNMYKYAPLMGALLIATLVATPSTAVEPQEIEGNPNCIDLGYDFGFKPLPEPPPTGNYAFPDGIHFVDITSDDIFFDWSSDLGIDAVIVKGGPGAYVYVYDPPQESFGDIGLHSPEVSSGNWAAISHIEFCYDYEVDVSKTAETSYTRTFEWAINKSVAPEAWSLFDGDTGTSDYVVSVEKTVTDSDFAVSGSITVFNDTHLNATIDSVTDVMTGPVTGDVVCNVAFPYELMAGATLVCSYSADLPDASNRVNTATVTTTGIVAGNDATADVIFGDPTITIGPESIDVDDSNGQGWHFDDSGSVTYPMTFTCADLTFVNNHASYVHPNTATIVQTSQSDSALVNVNCYELGVSKDAQTSMDRTYMWDVIKWAEDADGHPLSELFLSPGQQIEVSYGVEVDIVSTSDDNYEVSGTISVANPAPMAAPLLSVIDVLPGAQGLSVDCPAAFPLQLASGATLTCTYGASLDDGTDRMNIAIASIQNYAYGANGATATGATQFTGTATVSFGGATINDQIDECVDISDTFIDALGNVCFGIDDLPALFTYTRWIGPYSAPDDCGLNVVENTATTITGDTGTTDASTWDIDVSVECESGCTLTPGYWKTHSLYGPAPYDDTWTAIGEDTPFFYAYGSDDVIQSYYEVLWTPPAGGNAYYILAHAYIAAVLNEFNGASVPGEIGVAMAEATLWFDDPDHTPAYAKGLKGKRGVEERAYLLMLASLIDDYNNGIFGPGHCSE